MTDPIISATSTSVWPARMREKTSSPAASVMAAARKSFSISSSCLINRRRLISSPTSISSVAPVREVITSAARRLR